ncbi:MAG: 6-bladed beta-propeller [Flavitalea sp.]
MKRRTFIQSTSMGIAGMIIQPGFHNSDENILGQNNKKYKIQKNWSKADASKFPVNDCHEMVQDSKKRIILLTNETKNNVLIYDKSGKLENSWGHDYPGAHGLTIFNEGGKDVLFICDNNRHQVIKTSVDGKELMVLNYPKETGMYSKEEEYVPTETTIASNGDIYVVDGYGKDFVIQYDHTGKYIRHFGGRGNEEKHLLNAHGITVDTRGSKPTLIVTSRQQNAFKRYTMEGEFIETIALPGAWVCRPVIKDDYLYAAVLQTDSKQGQNSGFITILDKNNKVVSNLGGNDPVYKDGKLESLYQTDKAFSYPHDVCIDDEGSLYVAQWNSGKVYPYKLTPVT